MFKQISPYLHQYDFPLVDIVKPHVNDIINQFLRFKDRMEMEGINNVPMINDDLANELDIKFKEVIEENYLVKDSFIKSTRPAFYIQNNKFFKSDLHNHIDTTSITLVSYINPPKEGDGGEIEFPHPPSENFVIHPSENKLYIFPGWLYHRPLKQINSDWRISINWGYLCMNRPIHKASKIMW